MHKCNNCISLIFPKFVSLSKIFFSKFSTSHSLQQVFSKKYYTRYFEKCFLLQISINRVGNVKAAPIHITKTTLQPQYDNLQIITKNILQLKVLNFKSWLLLTAACLQLLQCVHFSSQLSGNVKNKSELLLGWFSWLGLQACAMYIYLLKNKGHQLKYYLDNLLAFRKKHTIKTCNLTSYPNTHSLIEFSNLLLGYLILLTAVGIGPCFVLILHWSNPCKPSLLGYFLLEECHRTNGSLNHVIQIIWTQIKTGTVFLFNIWLWYFGFHGLAFGFTVVHITLTMIVRECIQLACRQTKSIYTNISDKCKIYRQLQILNILCNSIQQSCLLTFLCAVTFTMSLSINLVIRFGSANIEDKFIFVTLFSFVTIDAIGSIIFILGGMVSVFVNSKNCLCCMKGLQLQCKSKFDRVWMRSFFRSCDTIKLKFGDNNFIEELTPFKTLDFAINLTVQILLVFRIN